MALGIPLFSPGCGGAPCSLPFPRTCAPGFGGGGCLAPFCHPAGPLPPPSLPSPSRAWRFGAAPLGLAPLAPRLLAGSRGTAVRDTTLPFPMPTQAAPRVPFPCLRTRALGWSVLRRWGSSPYVAPWCPSLLAAPLGSPLAGSGRLGLG